MKRTVIVLLSLLWLPLAAQAAEQDVVEIAVSGLACPFCAYGLEKNLSELPEVDSVTVDLAQNSARVVIKPEHKADLETIKAAIVKAGFTPGDSTTSVTQD